MRRSQVMRLEMPDPRIDRADPCFWGLACQSETCRCLPAADQVRLGHDACRAKHYYIPFAIQTLQLRALGILFKRI